MAIDDVVSDYETDVANNARMSVQPASGDEWLITQALTISAGSNTGISPHTVNGDYNMGLWGGGTADEQLLLSDVGVHPVKFLVTNSEYIRLFNSSGGTITMGFSAIKTKD
jgi:hypothetical protein